MTDPMPPIDAQPAEGRGRPLDRLLRWWAHAVVIGSSGWLVLSVATGRLGNIGGDAAVRLVTANDCLTRPAGCWGPLLDGPWPVGQTMVLSPTIALGGLLGLAPPTSGAMLAVVLFAASAVLVGSLAAALADDLARAVTVTLFVALPVVLYYATNTYAEVFSTAPLLAGLVVFARQPRPSPARAALVGAWILVASTVRTEAIFVGAVLVCLLAWRRLWKAAVVLGAIAISYTLAMLALPSSPRGLTYADIGPWYGFVSGGEALRQVRATVLAVMTSPTPLFGALVLVGMVVLLLARRDRTVSVIVVAQVVVTTGLLAVLGMIKTTDRYYIWAAVMGAVVVGQLVAEVRRRWPSGALATGMGLAGIVALLAGLVWQGVRVQAEIRERYTAFVNVQATEMSRWLRSQLGPDDYLYFDFLRFYDIWFRSQLDPAGSLRPHYDYTSFYSGVPQRQIVPLPVSERSRSEQLRDFGQQYLRTSCPTFVVTTTGQLLRRVLVEQPGLSSVTPYLEELPDGTFGYRDPDRVHGKDRILRLAHENAWFRAYRVDGC